MLHEELLAPVIPFVESMGVKAPSGMYHEELMVPVKVSEKMKAALAVGAKKEFAKRINKTARVDRIFFVITSCGSKLLRQYHVFSVLSVLHLTKNKIW